MALPGSGTLTWDQIRFEFGGGYPIYISDYYRGGPRVPNIPANAGVPTSGLIAASHFYGASAATVFLTNASQMDNKFAPNNALAGLGFSGSIVRGRQGTPSSSYNTKYTWLLAGSASDYQVYASHAIGTAPAGAALNTWHTLGGNVEWTLTRTVTGEVSGGLNIQVRVAATGVVVATCTFSMSANKEV